MIAGRVLSASHAIHPVDPNLFMAMIELTRRSKTSSVGYGMGCWFDGVRGCHARGKAVDLVDCVPSDYTIYISQI